jgi:hypothetical protein
VIAHALEAYHIRMVLRIGRRTILGVVMVMMVVAMMRVALREHRGRK